MPSKVQGELLPPGWKVSQWVQEKVSNSCAYYLNDKKTLEKLKGHATKTPPMVFETKGDNSLSFQFSTGAYMESVSPLLSYWKDAEGKDYFNLEDTDGLEVKVTKVEATVENGGKTVQTIVRLDVHGEKVTITCYDTKVSMRVQGGPGGSPQMDQFVKRALLPYLNAEIKKHETGIHEINLHFQQLGSKSKVMGKKGTAEAANPNT